MVDLKVIKQTDEELMMLLLKSLIDKEQYRVNCK